MGLPQMISSRAQFGVKGAVVPLVLVILMYLGFAATGTVLAGQAVNKILHIDSPPSASSSSVSSPHSSRSPATS